jgi:hypothetical protein
LPTVASDLLTKRERALAEHYRRAYPWLDQVEPNGRQVPVREGWARCPECGHLQWALTPRECVRCGVRPVGK